MFKQAKNSSINNVHVQPRIMWVDGKHQEEHHEGCCEENGGATREVCLGGEKGTRGGEAVTKGKWKVSDVKVEERRWHGWEWQLKSTAKHTVRFKTPIFQSDNYEVKMFCIGVRDKRDSGQYLLCISDSRKLLWWLNVSSASLRTHILLEDPITRWHELVLSFFYLLLNLLILSD